MCKPPVPATVHYSESHSSLFFLRLLLNELSYVCVTRKPAWDPKKRYLYVDLALIHRTPRSSPPVHRVMIATLVIILEESDCHLIYGDDNPCVKTVILI